MKTFLDELRSFRSSKRSFCSMLQNISNGHFNDAQIGALLGAFEELPLEKEEFFFLVSFLKEKQTPLDTLNIFDGTCPLSALMANWLAKGALIPVKSFIDRSLSLGLADLLQALGCSLHLLEKKEEESFAFFSHPLESATRAVRKSLGAPTIFDLAFLCAYPAKKHILRFSSKESYLFALYVFEHLALETVYLLYEETLCSIASGKVIKEEKIKNPPTEKKAFYELVDLAYLILEKEDEGDFLSSLVSANLAFSLFQKPPLTKSSSLSFVKKAFSETPSKIAFE